MIEERYTAPLSRYSNTNKGMPVDEVEAWLDQFPQKRAENKPSGGIIRSIADTRELYLREMSPRERKVARAKAQREHRQALKNVAKQEAADAKEIAKKLAEWRRENAKADKKEKAVKRDGLSLAGREVLKTLTEQGFYNVADFKLSYKYFQGILKAIRKMGYTVRGERESRTIVRYILVNKKPLRE